MDNPIELIDKINSLRQVLNNDLALILILFVVFIFIIGYIYIRLRISKENDKREIINTVQEMLVNDSKSYRIHIENEVKEQKSEISKLKEERVSLLRRIELLEIELRYANIQIENNKKNQERIENLQKKLNEMQSSLIAFKDQLDILKDENTKLRNELATKSDYINTLEEQIIKLKEEINDERDEQLDASID